MAFHSLRCPTTFFFLFSLLLAACLTQPTGSPPTVVVTSTPLPQTPTAVPSPTPAPTATPAPIELVVCQTNEPASLYIYGGDFSARAGIHEALFDGPIDSVGYAYQPVILQSLPSLENGRAALSEVEVRPGDAVMDAATGAVAPLEDGVHLVQPDGSQLAYAGPDPARTVQVSAEFKLREGLLWSDGQALTADDSVFSFEIASSPDTPISKFVVNRTARYEAVDPLTTRWTGLPGWLDAEFALRFWAPLPRHLYGQLTAADLLASAEAAQRPIGWGPFMIGPAGWVQGDHLTLVRNPHYFRAAEGLPRVDRVVFRFGMDSDRIIAELLAGRCDIGAEQADFGGQIPFLLQAQESGLLAPQFVTGTAFEHLDFGIQPREDYARSAGNDLFQDVRVRHAIAYCLDRQALVRDMVNGLSEVPAAYLPSRHPLYAADLVTVYPFDPDRGRALLEEAGWVDRDSDGVREAEDGRRRLVLDYASGPAGSVFRETLMRLVQSQLFNHCGVDLRLQLYSAEELYDTWPNGVLFGRRFDLGQFPWRAGIEPPCDLYLTESIPSDENPVGVNNTGYSNPAFDQACLGAKSALDEATRRDKHAEAQAIFTQDLPSIALFLRVKVGVALARVEGYQVDATASSDLWNIEQISLAQP